MRRFHGSDAGFGFEGVDELRHLPGAPLDSTGLANFARGLKLTGFFEQIVPVLRRPGMQRKRVVRFTAG